MLCWMLFFVACAFVSFAIALGGEVVFAAFATYLMETSALSGVMSELLTFVALDQLELGGILLRKESLMVDVIPCLMHLSAISGLEQNTTREKWRALSLSFR